MSQFDNLFTDTQVKTKPKSPAAKTRPKSIAQMPVEMIAVSEKKKKGKSDDKRFRQVLTYLKVETHKAVKAELIFDEQERDLSDLVEELLTGWLAGKRNG